MIDPTWRADYEKVYFPGEDRPRAFVSEPEGPCEQAGVHLSGVGHSQAECPTMGGE